MTRLARGEIDPIGRSKLGGTAALHGIKSCISIARARFPSLQVDRGCFVAPASPSPASRALRLPPASRGRPLCALDSSACLMQSLHRLLLRWCSQMLPRPQSLHVLRTRWCSQMAPPPNPCTCSGRAGARRRLTRRTPCTCSGRAGARRWPRRRNPCTGSDALVLADGPAAAILALAPAQMADPHAV